MNCPKCNLPMNLVNGTEGADPHYFCLWCEESHPVPAGCAHEPANFSLGAEGEATYHPFGESDRVTVPFYVCRLCGQFYTDLDAVAAGEKKYQEAQERK